MLAANGLKYSGAQQGEDGEEKIKGRMDVEVVAIVPSR